MEHRAFCVEPRLLDLAKEMRSKPAPAEKKLWFCLRNRKLGGLKFRRQFAVEQYIADFYCAEFRLIIEIDGESHDDRGEYDSKRTDKLIAMGYAIVRYSNVDVHENLEGVLLDILRRCEGRRNLQLGPSPLPSPLNTGERE